MNLFLAGKKQRMQFKMQGIIKKKATVAIPIPYYPKVFQNISFLLRFGGEKVHVLKYS